MACYAVLRLYGALASTGTKASKHILDFSAQGVVFCCMFNSRIERCRQLFAQPLALGRLRQGCPHFPAGGSSCTVQITTLLFAGSPQAADLAAACGWSVVHKMHTQLEVYCHSANAIGPRPDGWNPYALHRLASSVVIVVEQAKGPGKLPPYQQIAMGHECSCQRLRMAWCASRRPFPSSHAMLAFGGVV